MLAPIMFLAQIADSIRYPNLRLATVAERPSTTPQATVGSKASNASIGPGVRSAVYHADSHEYFGNSTGSMPMTHVHARAPCALARAR